MPPMEVTAYWWSRTAYEDAARTAGFTRISWHRYTVSPAGLERYGPDLWDNYLRQPHAVIIEAS